MANICSEHIEISASSEKDLASLLEEMLTNVENFLSYARHLT